MNLLNWINALNECKEKGMKVFSIPELMNLSRQSAPTLRRTLVRLKEKKILHGVYRGLWGYGKNITLEDLFQKIDPDAYVSLETVLGRCNIIKAMTPDLTCISFSQSRVIKTAIGTLVFHKIKRELFFGFDDLHFASPEKALLDYIYLRIKAGKEIQWNKLNLSKIHRGKLGACLKKFPNFVKEGLHNLNV